jgi:hypothetical protein
MDPMPSIAQVLPEGQRGIGPARRWVIIGLGVFVAIMIAVVAAVVVSRDDVTSGDPLYVLPSPAGQWQLSGGVVTAPDPSAPATEERFITVGSLYGLADGNGFDGLRSIARYPESPLPGAEWEAARTPRGDAYRRLDDSMTFALEDSWRNGWLVARSPSSSVHAYDMLSDDTFDLVLVAAFLPPETPDVPSTSFEMTSPGGPTFAVTTTPSASPLFDVAGYAERVEPVDVDGISGWVIVDEQESWPEVTVTWSPVTGRTVSVRGTASIDATVAAARILQPVAADDWTAVFPDALAD